VRSVNSWDLSVDILEIDGSKIIFLDKRETFDLLPVNETSRDPPTGEEGLKLAEELALVNQQFSQHVLKKGGKLFRPPGAGPNPFVEGNEDVATALYKYRRWKLSETCQLYARTQVDSIIKTAGGKDATVRTFALLEYDTKITDWRKKLEQAVGAVLATEIKNNSCTLAKWTLASMLSGADVMKLGYVGRTTPSSRTDHEVLQVQSYAPRDFAVQMALKERNAWGIIRNVIDQCLKLAEGKYVLLKDPNKNILHLYLLPPDAEQTEGTW
jgi:translation initiation factor 3 subunit D